MEKDYFCVYKVYLHCYCKNNNAVILIDYRKTRS